MLDDGYEYLDMALYSNLLLPAVDQVISKMNRFVKTHGIKTTVRNTSSSDCFIEILNIRKSRVQVHINGTRTKNVKIVWVLDLNLSTGTEIIDVRYYLHLSKSIDRKKTTNR